ncbi:AraC family transcriptional regulator [Treponema zuelzerae]|uniref:AraC family transcriptional regulator n=1 Tax=Teretinema zuelzerae TaxID=156 RepID=A0AAE3JJA5_9SPIR|nr:helix-turn-helix domain-containing protein [Teretinema zuelzerae]MCD1654010.1 AraC family transcriptional regulator [Teretinema zuelzerae]
MKRFSFPGLRNIRAGDCGCAMLHPGWKHMSRCLSRDSVFILGRKNAAPLVIGEETAEIRPGRVLILPAGIPHRGLAGIQEPVSYYWMHFRLPCQPLPIPEAEPERSAFPLAPDGVVLPLYVDLSEPLLVSRLFRELLQERRQHRTESLAADLLCAGILLKAARLSDDRAAVDGKRIPEILLMVEDELSNPDLSVKYIAVRAGLNEDYLGRIFREATGGPLGRYIITRRVELAANRLRDTHCAQEQIARGCGFSSMRQFRHHFKEVAGTSPGLYRRQSQLIETNTL